MTVGDGDMIAGVRKERRGMGAATISAGYPQGFVRFATGRGVDRDALMARTGISETDLTHQDNRVPLDRYVALLDTAAELAGDPAIALRYGEAVRMQEISIVGLICEACETTADVARELNRYAALVMDDCAAEPAALMRGAVCDGQFWIEAPHPVFAAHPRVIEAEFARLVWNTRIMFARDAAFARMRYPHEVCFVHADPGYAAEYARVFDAPVRFGCRHNAMRIDPAFAQLRQPPVNRYVFGVLSERAEMLLKAVEESRTMRGRVETVLAGLLHTGACGMDRVAEKLGASRQTLYRSLKAEDVTFEQVLDDLRRRLALSYLADRKVSVNETAYLVGFSEPAAFSRAFKRWTGESPSAVRRQ